MSKGLHTFKKTDLARALRAAPETDMNVAGVEIRADGAIVLQFGDRHTEPKKNDEVENWLAKHEHHAD